MPGHHSSCGEPYVLLMITYSRSWLSSIQESCPGR
nr:MAG TPA: hypothetical protein [Caudoviricetes sp.]